MKKFPLLLLAAPVLVACGGSSNAQVKVDPVAYVKHAAQKTAGTPSEHVTMSGTFYVGGPPGLGGLNLKMTGSGDFANATKRGQLTVVTADGQNTQTREILDGTTIYVYSPTSSHDLPRGKTWMKVRLEAAMSSMGYNYSSFIAQSPTQALKHLGAAGSVTSVGTETIDGVKTTHYQVTNLDISKLPQGARLHGPINVWIGNKDGYVYRESFSFAYSIEGQSGSTSMRLDLSKFGEKVDVTVPSQDEVFDATIGGRA